MFQKLVSRNEDLRRLYEKGYAIGFDTNNCLIVRDVFYLDGTLALRRGAIEPEVESGAARIRGEDLEEDESCPW